MLKNQARFLWPPTFIAPPSYNRKQFYQHRHFYILHTGFSCAIHLLEHVFFFTCRNYFSFTISYLYYACENIILIYESELYSSAQFLPFFFTFKFVWKCKWGVDGRQVIPTSLGGSFLLHFLEAKNNDTGPEM